jgi:hypothetical protein
MTTVGHAIKDQSKSILFFEVPNALSTVRDLAIWDLIYEHCSYFTPQSLTRLFAASGFCVKRTYEVYEGQFICTEASAKKEESSDDCLLIHVDDALRNHIDDFAQSFHRKIKEWRHRLKEMFMTEKRIVVWGAGSKGATFLNLNSAADQIRYVVDINPRKQGMYVSGTGQEIVSPEFLKDYDPDLVLIMNPIYNEEIRGVMRLLDISCHIQCV